jgi:hypothetical protein
MTKMDHENTWDFSLRIKTVGRDETNADEYHHPYEPTPYSVLERLVTVGSSGKTMWFWIMAAERAG